MGLGRLEPGECVMTPGEVRTMDALGFKGPIRSHLLVDTGR